MCCTILCVMNVFSEFGVVLLCMCCVVLQMLEFVCVLITLCHCTKGCNITFAINGHKPVKGDAFPLRTSL